MAPSLRHGFSRHAAREAWRKPTHNASNPEGFGCHRGMMLSRDPVLVVGATFDTQANKSLFQLGAQRIESLSP